MRTSLFPVSCAVFSVLLLASPVRSEPGLSWNRAVLDLTAEPLVGGPPDLHDIVLVWAFELVGEGAVSDLGTEAEISWGTPFGNPECIIWDIQDSCTHACAANDSCGTSIIDGVTVSLDCGAGDGICRSPQLTGRVAGVRLFPGDEITVLLRPAPGAAPESDTSDDSLTIVLGVTAAGQAVDSRSWSGVKLLYR